MKKISKMHAMILITFSLLSFVLFFEPGIFKEYEFYKYDKIFDILKLLVIPVVYIYYIFYKIREKNYKKSIPLLILCFYQIYCGLVTFFTYGDLIRFIGPALTSIAILMIVEVLAYYGKLFITLKNLNIYFRICYAINVICIFIILFILKNNNSVFFLGIDNRFIFTFYAWMLSESIVDINEHGKLTKTSWIVFFLIESSLLLVKTVSAMIIFILWIIPLLYSKYNFKFNLKEKSNNIFISIFLFDILIVRYRLSYMFNNFLTKIGKFPHLSGRVLIWNTIFDNIVPNNFWFGIGMQSAEDDMYYFGSHIGDVYSVSHAHNTFIDILYRYGFIGVIIFISLIVYSIKKINYNKDNMYFYPLFISLIIILLLGVFDTLIYAGLFFLIALICNIDLLNIKNNN